MLIMLLCILGLFVSSQKKCNEKRIILNVQNLQQKTKTIQTESDIKSTT